MLNWDKIDNYHILQRLVNHLFALECNSPGFIPSSPYIGADGAWDGYYKGYYDYEKQDGLWSIQSKWTKKSHKDAFDHLKKEIKKELQKAKKKNVDHLRIATNAELKVDHIIELEKLNNGEVVSLRVWHREELERRIDLQPYLRYRFFGFPQYPKFVLSNEYFDKIEEHLLPVSASKIIKFNDYIKKIKLFLLSKNQYILLIHSPGGYGKSHLLREIAQITHQTDRERQAWMIWAGRREMRDAFQDEIVEGRKYLLVFDDADRCLEEIKPLFSIVRSRGGSVKVILALRTSGFEYIYDKISDLRLEEYYDEMKILDWSKDDLVRLLRLAAGKGEIEDEDTIATLYPNPYLIVQIGRILKKDPSVDFEKIKEKIANEIYHEAKTCSKDVLSLELENFLTYLTCLVPFSRNDRIFEFLITQFNGKIEKVIDSLEKAGVLRTIGNSYRFNPDMKGDLYLARQLEKADPEKIERLIPELLPISPERLFTNLEAAAGYFENESIRGPLSRIIYSWIKSAESTSTHSKAERLKLVGKIAYFIPEYALMLLHAYLDSETSLTTDDYGPVIRKLMRIPSMRREVVELIEKIEMKGIRGHYTNYKPTSLIEDSISPLYNAPDVILETLDIFLEWSQNPNSSRITLISAGVTEVLASSHQYTKSKIGAMTFGRKILENTPEICNIRNKALQILKEMVAHPLLEVELAAIEIAREIGKGNLGDTSEGEIPLSSKIAGEREEIVKEMGSLISSKIDFNLLNVIENLFLDWWAQEKPGTRKVKEFLRIFPRSIEYMVFKHFVSPGYAFEDFYVLEKQAPIEGKWHWFVHMSMDKFAHPKLEDFQPLVESLSKKYNDEMKIIEFLRCLDGKLLPCDRILNPPIVSCWVNQEPELFFTLRNSEELWEQTPERFTDEIDFALADLNEDFVYKLAVEVLSGLPTTPIPKVDNFLRVLMRRSIPDATLEVWLSELLKRGSAEIRNRAIRYADFIFDRNKNYNLFFKLLTLAISRGDILRNNTIESLSLIFHNPCKEFKSFEGKSRESFRKELLCKLRDVPVFDWRSEKLWGFVFDGIDSVIDFLEYRFQKFIEIREKHITDQRYKIIPFEGMDCIKNQIGSFEDYEKLMGKVIEWYDRGLGVYDLKHLMRQANSLRNIDGGLYFEEYIDKQLQSGRIRDAIIISRFLPFNENTIDLFIKVIEKAATPEELKEVEELLDHGMDSDMAWISKPGEPSPELVEKKDLYKRIHERMKPGKTRMFIEKLIERIDMQIDIKLKHDEEFLNPRG
ncbi:MAG: hypothetical protein HXS48_17750 [Theionarchaea archaeon]|nr:hypothetical protein [Theionarchaea archaeon]